MPESYVLTPAHHFSGDTQAERTALWAEAARQNALDFEQRARVGDPYLSKRAWVDGHIVDWWQPEVENLKRTGQLGLALDLAWLLQPDGPDSFRLGSRSISEGRAGRRRVPE